ncbi:MAG: ferrous iron transport protein A [Proteobacteria bacterium]|nr:ferrous iron transport protein A [Pseudomonadota bacterium]
MSPGTDTARPPNSLGLEELPLDIEAQIVALDAPPGREAGDLTERLAEMGFLPGERVRLLARALFGEPLAVRVGSDTFALRRAEAACIRVVALAGVPAAAP